MPKKILDNLPSIANNSWQMPDAFSTREAARKLGIDVSTLSRYISLKKIPAPKLLRVGRLRVHSWAEEDIERVRKLLPKIANGRKTRYQKLREKQKKTPAKAPVPHKPKKKK